MGVGASKQSVSDDPFLACFIGEKALAQSDEQISEQLCHYNWLPATSKHLEIQLEERLAPFLKSYILNDEKSRNFARILAFTNKTLLQLEQLDGLEASAKRDDPEHEEKLQTTKKILFNSIQIIRHCAKTMIENLTEEDFIMRCSMLTPSLVEYGFEMLPQASTSVCNLMQSLVKLIIRNEKSYAGNYLLTYEAVSTIIVMFSASLFKHSPAEFSILSKCFAQDARIEPLASNFVRVLTQYYIDNEKLPPDYRTAGGSIIFDLASGIMNMFSGSNSSPSDLNPVAERSELLLLMLASSLPSDKNFFSKSFYAMGNLDSEVYKASMNISYNKLWNRICDGLASNNVEPHLFLLYHLLLGNKYFKLSVSERSDIERLLLPLLRVVYDAQNLKTHVLYLATISLLMLTQDEFFNKVINEQGYKPANCVWYQERNLPVMSLGSFLFLNLVRVLSINISSIRDRYLHNNCSAALANMSSEVKNLHSVPVQRLTAFFEQVSKRYRKTLTEIRRNSSSGPVQENENQNMEELAVLEELLRMILEVVNGILYNQMQFNPNMVHTMLYKRTLFQNFRGNPAFSDVIQNLEQVIQYFYTEVDKCGQEIVGAEQVLEVITSATKKFPFEKLKKFPKLNFKYVEESNSCEFFSPFCWKLVTDRIMHWPEHKILLFDALKEMEEDAFCFDEECVDVGADGGGNDSTPEPTKPSNNEADKT